MKKGASRPGAMRMRPSAPTPKWRSQTARTSSGVIWWRSARSSTTTKSLPVPCALTNSTALALRKNLEGPGEALRPGGKGTPSHPRVPAEPGELAPRVGAGARDHRVQRLLQRGTALHGVEQLLVAEGLP